MRLVQRHHNPGQTPGGFAERAGVHPLGEAVGHHSGQHLGGGRRIGEVRLVVKVAVAQLADYRVELLGGTSDVHDNIVSVESFPSEGGVHDVCGTVQPLRRPEHGAARLWATIMWSRIVTLNMPVLPRRR